MNKDLAAMPATPERIELPNGWKIEKVALPNKQLGEAEDFICDRGGSVVGTIREAHSARFAAAMSQAANPPHDAQPAPSVSDEALAREILNHSETNAEADAYSVEIVAAILARHRKPAMPAQPVTGDAAQRSGWLQRNDPKTGAMQLKTPNGELIEGRAAFEVFDALAAAPQPALPAWRDISSAPKDGTEIVLFNPKYKFLPKARWGEIDGETDDDVEGWFNGWLLENDVYVGTAEGCLGYMEDIEDGLMPTHWMPLPAAPTNGEAS